MDNYFYQIIGFVILFLYYFVGEVLWITVVYVGSIEV